MTSLANEYILLDYAKSNRCKCQLCSQPIKLETLKIGHVINRKGSSRFEKKVWYHLGCMTQMIKGERNTQLDIVGLYSLRESDQKLVKTKFEQLKANGYQKSSIEIVKETKYLEKHTEAFATFNKERRHIYSNYQNYIRYCEKNDKPIYM